MSCLDDRKLTMFPAASEQCKVEDEVTRIISSTCFVLVGCWRPGRGWHNVEKVENSSTMIVKHFLKEEARMVLLFLLLNNPFKIFFALE